MRYTATINYNFRGVQGTSPKVLLTNIEDEKGREFRDHCWVELTTKLEAYLPKTNKETVTVEFSAREKEYKSYGFDGEDKTTLKRIRDIKLIK